MVCFLNNGFLVALCVFIMRTITTGSPSQLDDRAELNGFEILSVEEYNKVVNATDRRGEDVVRCSFDKGWCGFRNQIRGDHFDWTLTTGSTSSRYTGPSSDLSGKGSYVYIEASLPRRSGHKARLLSPMLSGMVYCLQFGYHAYGRDIGALVVYKKRLDNKREQLLKLKKEFGKKWQYVVGTVVHQERFQIEFDGICGYGYRGDIALDNIIITKGKCSVSAKRNSDECGFGYPGFLPSISVFPPYYNWPWLVGLSSGKARSICTGARVGHEWLVTSRQCVNKLSKRDITTYTGSPYLERTRVIKIKQHPLQDFHTVLLQLNRSTSDRVTENVCLPPSLTTYIPVQKCILLATSFSVHGNVFQESTVTILPVSNCANHSQSTQWTHKDKERLLCVQPDPRHIVNHTQTKYDGYVVCENHLMQRWILHGLGSFSFSNVNTRPFLFTRVSTVVDWIEKLLNKSMLIPKSPLKISDGTPNVQTRGFQIFELRKQKCLVFVSDSKRFIYKTCNVYDTSQRFQWSRHRQLVTVTTNQCLSIDSSAKRYLQVSICRDARRSHKWRCMGKSIFNNYHRTLFIDSKGQDDDWVQLSIEPERRGLFVIYGTKDYLCSIRQTKRGVLRCNYARDVMCGFVHKDRRSQFRWIARQATPTDVKAFPFLLPSDRFFKVLRRSGHGDRKAAIGSPWFGGQRCVWFRALVHAPQTDRLMVYRNDDGRKHVLLRITGKKRPRWGSYRVTVRSEQCETYQVLFEAILETRVYSKIGLRDIAIYPGPCERRVKQKAGKCLKGWMFISGSCYYVHAINTTWHQALAVCQITEADLPTDIAVSRLLTNGSTTWFGRRSCPNGALYSTQGIRYGYSGSRVANPICLRLHRPNHRRPTYRPSSCDSQFPFVCQKDPRKTETGCGLKNVSYTNGRGSAVNSADRQWPWHALIIVDKKCVCAGTMVAPGYVVTSAQCVTQFSPNQVTIFMPSSRTAIRQVKRIIIHPKFGLKSGDNDIAILFFDEKVLSNTPVSFACVNKMTSLWRRSRSSKSDLLKNAKCLVLGWGTYKGSRTFCGPNRYRATEVEIVDRSTCEKYYGKHMITKRMLCVRPKDGNKSCLGDSGGPLVCELSGAWTLMGITSWGTGCVTTRLYGIYTDMASMQPWMDSITDNVHKKAWH